MSIANSRRKALQHWQQAKHEISAVRVVLSFIFVSL